LRGRRNQLEGGFGRPGAVELGEEGAAGARSAKPLEERVSLVNNLTDPVAANRNSIHGFLSVVEQNQGLAEQGTEGTQVGTAGA